MIKYLHRGRFLVVAIVVVEIILNVPDGFVVA